MLPIWTPFFLLLLLILASVWGMPLIINSDALEGIFSHSKQSPTADWCPAELNPAVRTFVSWPNQEVNEDQTVLAKETKPEQIPNQEGQSNNQVEVNANFKNLELQPVMVTKEEKLLEQNKELKVQENGKEIIKRTPYHQVRGNVKGRKSRQIKPHLTSKYKR